MDNSIWTAILALVGTALGTIGSARLTAYRIQQLEKKVEKHNCLVERVYVLETKLDDHIKGE